MCAQRRSRAYDVLLFVVSPVRSAPERPRFQQAAIRRPIWVVGSMKSSAVSAVILADTWPVVSVALVAYLARYPATAVSAIGPVDSSFRVATWTGRMSYCSPQEMSHPSGLSG